MSRAAIVSSLVDPAGKPDPLIQAADPLVVACAGIAGNLDGVLQLVAEQRQPVPRRHLGVHRRSSEIAPPVPPHESGPRQKDVGHVADFYVDEDVRRLDPLDERVEEARISPPPPSARVRRRRCRADVRRRMARSVGAGTAQENGNQHPHGGVQSRVVAPPSRAVRRNVTSVRRSRRRH